MIESSSAQNCYRVCGKHLHPRLEAVWRFNQKALGGSPRALSLQPICGWTKKKLGRSNRRGSSWYLECIGFSVVLVSQVAIRGDDIDGGAGGKTMASRYERRRQRHPYESLSARRNGSERDVCGLQAINKSERRRRPLFLGS